MGGLRGPGRDSARVCGVLREIRADRTRAGSGPGSRLDRSSGRTGEGGPARGRRGACARAGRGEPGRRYRERRKKQGEKKKKKIEDKNIIHKKDQNRKKKGIQQ
eukprot:TRINITY_DN36383_c0_g3_i1.p3 TRINITY_DN36383_c0_g3~~TRINITY_DN36383_c0_g3_i1.p3  ORF type:complete len:104 (-),score=14.84 TRINITY_DN36383_c0_g3_i1:48-359(-)